MINGFYIPRRDFFLGRELKHGETGNAKFLRLIRKGKGAWQRPVHETLIVEGIVEGKTKTLTNSIIHNPHEDIFAFLAKINFYTDINSKYLFNQGVKISFLEIIFYPFGKFIANYFFKRGFLDGTHGFVHAMTMSFHSFLTRAKIYLLTKENKTVKLTV